MEALENKSPACLEPSPSRERILVKDKPSPLRIVKRSRNDYGWDKIILKGGCTAAYFDPSPTGSPPGALRRSADGALKIPRRRPKIVCEEKGNDAATGSRRSSNRSSLGNSSMNRDEDDDVTEQGKAHRTSSLLRYPAGKIKTFRRNRHSLKSNFANSSGDGNLSMCILPEECSLRPDSSSRASSRCTTHDYDGTYCSMVSPLLPDSSLLKKSTLVLSPYIRVVSEAAGIPADKQHLWAAVEVSGKLFSAADEPELEPQTMHYSDQDICSRFGYLYNLTIDISPTSNSSLLQIICQQQFPTTMSVGSSILLLVHVVCKPSIESSSSFSSSRQYRHIRQRSDELMEDLQLQLGDSVISYMNIHVSYSHSAFPSKSAAVEVSGMSSFHTRLSTTAEATVKLHNALSPWSPHPVSVQDRIYPLLKCHWGPQKASETMKQMLMQRSALASSHIEAPTEEYEREVAQEPLHDVYSPMISPRQTSLQGTQQMKVKLRPSSHPTPFKKAPHDWLVGMRGVSDAVGSETRKLVKSVNGGKGGKEASLRDGWSTTTDAFGSLTPSLLNNAYGEHSEDGEDDKSIKGKDRKEGATRDNIRKKNAGLWTWATWF